MDGIRKWVRRKGIATTTVPSPGGAALAVHVSDLPEETQIALAQRAAGVDPVAADPERWRALRKASPSVRQEAERRLSIVLHYRDALARTGSKRAAVAECGVSQATVGRWLAMIEGIPQPDWLPALAPAWQPGGRKAECSPEAWDHFLGNFLRRNGPKLSTAYDTTARAARQAGWMWPSEVTIRRKLKREFDAAEIQHAREGRKAVANLYPPQQRDPTVYRAGQAHNYDGLEPSVLIRWPDGEIRRMVIVAAQDVRSRKILAFGIDKTENSDLYRAVFGRVSEDCGHYPNVAYFDNTRAAANKKMTGGIRRRNRFKHDDGDPLGFLPALGVNVIFVTPSHGQAKPIERGFRDLKELIERDPRCAAAYSGDDPRQREGREPDPIDIEVAETVVYEAIAAHNAKPGRRTDACQGRLSFDEAYALDFETSPVRRALPEHRHYWLYDVKKVRCRKERGEIVLFKNRFHAPDLVNHRGRDVLARFDPHDMHAGIFVETLDGREICHAPCIAKVGFNDTRAMREHTRARKNYARSIAATTSAKRRLTAAEAARNMPSVGAQPAAQSKVSAIARPKSRATGTNKPNVASEKEKEMERNFRSQLDRMWREKMAG